MAFANSVSIMLLYDHSRSNSTIRPKCPLQTKWLLPVMEMRIGARAIRGNRIYETICGGSAAYHNVGTACCSPGAGTHDRSRQEAIEVNKTTLFLVAMTMLMPAAASVAQSSTANEVFVGGTPIMRVRVAGGGYTTQERASEIQERVNEALSHGPVRESDITVEPAGNEAVVMVKGNLLFTADWATARFNDATPTELANKWADDMRLVLPALTEAK